jgi:tetratricopeptide (TPR) repeat protein
VKGFRARAYMLGGLLLVGAGPLVSTVDAQRRNPAEERFVVHHFRGEDRRAAHSIAEAVRERVATDLRRSYGTFYTAATLNANLSASGFDTLAAPDPITAHQLSRALRVDEYLEGRVTRGERGMRLEPMLILTVDRDVQQPLPPAEGSARDIANQVSRSLQAAMRQLPATRECQNAYRAGEYAQAIAHARAGIQEYDQATLARVCLARAMAGMNAPPDSIIRVTDAILEIDPRNKPALYLSGQAHKDAGNVDVAVERWTELVVLDPRNIRLQQQLAEEFARLGQAERAKPIIERVMQENPGDPDMMRLHFLILLANRDWRDAIQSGERLVQLDTSAADPDFFRQMATAYASDTQPQRAAEMTARGVAKFPNDGQLWSLHSQTLRSAGQVQQSVEAADRALAINPQDPLAHLRRAQALADLERDAESLSALRSALQHGADSAFVGQMALVQGNRAYQAARQAGARPALLQAAQILAFADSASPSVNAKFLLGVTSFQIGDSAVRENQRARSCELARLARENFTTAQINIMAGAQAQPQTAQQLLGALGQYGPTVENQIRQFCR